MTDRYASIRKVPLRVRAVAVERCAAGEGYAEVAKDYGVAYGTIQGWCVARFGPQWKHGARRKKYTWKSEATRYRIGRRAS